MLVAGLDVVVVAVLELEDSFDVIVKTFIQISGDYDPVKITGHQQNYH